MKILFPSVFYLPQVMGGIELYIQHLAKGLQAKGHDVKVIIPAFEKEVVVPYEYKGIKVLRYRGRYPKNRLQFSGIEPNESLENFIAAVKDEKPDIIHFSQITNSSGISLHHIKAAASTGAKIVYTNHLSEFICQRGDFMYKGVSNCDGLATEKKCTVCLLHKKRRWRCRSNGCYSS